MANGKRKPMRQGQQNRRGRGRGRKPQNPLSRNYESNGPDVKIRGNAAHIADKYSALARDALASGDTITAENFLQHAEHYYRIIMAAQSQQNASAQQPSEGANGSGGSRPQGDGAAEAPEAASENAANGSEAEVQADAAKANGKSKKESKAGSDEAQTGDEASSDNAAA
jgi:hypothetical protein